MDSKAFIAALSSNLSAKPQESRQLVDALAAVIAESVGNNEAVSVPRFGTFDAVKEDERISTDLSSGKRVLLPPGISVTFRAGAALRKAVKKGEA